MDRIRILDCTLRDGGYCNQWKFGFQNTKAITDGLIAANIDIVECGFFTKTQPYDRNVSKYNTLDQVAQVIPENRGEKLFVCMINYGEYDVENLPEYDGRSLDGFRVAFHKKDLIPALEVCKEIQKKGYKVFVQAMVSLTYTDKEFIELIQRCNEFTPYAFYIVDSFGVMKKKDLIRFFYMTENNLDESINIGYHSHNNMQLAYSNTQVLVEIQTKRSIILDSSIFGMGRGAGNLNTELISEYLNDNVNMKYRLKPLLILIDEVLNTFFQKKYWGYSLPNYLSAKHNLHPDYAIYLDERKTLPAEDMDEIFSNMSDEMRNNFNKEYIDQAYINHMEKWMVQEERLSEMRRMVSGKEVLLIAPGKTSFDEKDKIIEFIRKKKIVSISINFSYPEYSTDFIFLSNLRRFKQLNEKDLEKSIVTSNIPAKGMYLQTKYTDLLNDIEDVKDNAGMLLIRLMISFGVRKIYLAGLDGYSNDTTQNFFSDELNHMMEKSVFDRMNEGLSEALLAFKKEVDFEFITTPKYITV